MAWTNVFTKTEKAVVITVAKAFIKHKATYTFRFETQKTDEKGTYLSPNFPLGEVDPSIFGTLLLDANAAVVLDMAKDNQAEADRVKALAAKPGSAIKAVGPAAVRDKNGPRSTGKTAKKKAKLAARAEASKTSHP